MRTEHHKTRQMWPVWQSLERAPETRAATVKNELARTILEIHTTPRGSGAKLLS